MKWDRQYRSKVLVAAFVLASLLVTNPPQVFTAQLQTLNVSYSALVPSGAPFWIAHELGLFEKEGLKVRDELAKF